MRSERARVRTVPGDETLVTLLGRRLLKRTPRDRQWASLAGAPRWADVAIGVGDADILLEVYARRSALLAIRSVQRRGSHAVLVNEHLRISGSETYRNALIIRMLSLQVRVARWLGISAIEHQMEPPDSEAPPFEWPLLGFDAALPGSLRPALPAALGEAKTVLHLAEHVTDRAWWREHRALLPRHLTFDLRTGSHSMRVFDAFLEKRRDGSSRPCEV